MAKQMVTAFGMSDVGPWAVQDQQSGDMIMRMMAKNSMSEKLQNDISVAVKKNYKRAKTVRHGTQAHLREQRSDGRNR